MSDRLQLGLLWGGLGLLWALGGCDLAPPQPIAQSLPSPAPRVTYRTWQTTRAVVHLLRIPGHSRYRILPAVRPQLTPLAAWVESLTANPAQSGQRLIAAINAGFFDPSNQLATAYVVINGKTVADPHDNPNLMQNPGLKPYLTQVLNRSEFRHYTCGSDRRYAITTHRTPPPAGCQLWDALGAGPQLLPEITAQAEAFIADDNGVRVRDPIGVDRPNARSAIALTADQTVIWLMVAQKPLPGEVSGMTLVEMQAVLKAEGAVAALNLDGGSSSSLYCGFCHSVATGSTSTSSPTWYGKLDPSGQRIQRPIQSVLLLYDTAPE